MDSCSTKQMKKLDELAVKSGISVEQLMENAGKAVAAAARKMGRKFIVLAGTGNNGGDGLVATRLLHNWGFDVNVAMPEKPKSELNKRHVMVLKVSGIKISKSADFPKNTVIIDALLGYGIKGPPRKSFAGLIRKANASGEKILSVDVPSGLDADTGFAYVPCIKANTTITLAFPKKGLLQKSAKPYVGKMIAGGIGIPPEIYKKAGIHAKKGFFKGMI